MILPSNNKRTLDYRFKNFYLIMFLLNNLQLISDYYIFLLFFKISSLLFRWFLLNINLILLFFHIRYFFLLFIFRNIFFHFFILSIKFPNEFTMLLNLYVYINKYPSTKNLKYISRTISTFHPKFGIFIFLLWCLFWRLLWSIIRRIKGKWF